MIIKILKGTVAVLLLVSLLSGCVEEDSVQDGDKRLIDTDYIGGEYNLSVLYMQNYFNGDWYNFTQIKYYKGGIEHEGVLLSYMEESLDWLKENTSVDSTILCWWDYGHMVEGVAERNALAEYPSFALKNTIAEFSYLNEEEKEDYIKNHHWDSNTTLEEIAQILTTENLSSIETQNLISKYSISYILTSSYDRFISGIFFDACGKDSSEYVSENNNPTAKGNSTLVFQMWQDNPDIKGLELVYSYYPAGYYHYGDSQNVRIYKLVNDTTDEDDNTTDTPVAVFDTTKGTFTVELYQDKTPTTCNNFIKLVNDGFYDGMIFHRISDDFMIQAGNTYPDGTTKESPYGSIDLEIHPDARHVDGAISMARTNDPDSATSQFFICDGAQAFLDDNYAVFGVVIDGIEVIRDIADEPHDNSSPAGGGKPDTDIIINSITIVE